MKFFIIIQALVVTSLLAIFFISELNFKTLFEDYPVIRFIVIIDILVITVFILGSFLLILDKFFLSIRLFFEYHYDKVVKIFLMIFSVFITIQIIVYIIIYFEWVEYTYDVILKNIYYNLIWIVPLLLLFRFAEKRCPVCKSFETSIKATRLHSRFIMTEYRSKGWDVNDPGESVSIYEYLEEIHFECNNCTYKSYSYELSRDDSSSVECLSEEEAKKYLKKHSSSDSIASMIAGGLLGLFFLS